MVLTCRPSVTCLTSISFQFSSVFKYTCTRRLEINWQLFNWNCLQLFKEQLLWDVRSVEFRIFFSKVNVKIKKNVHFGEFGGLMLAFQFTYCVHNINRESKKHVTITILYNFCRYRLIDWLRRLNVPPTHYRSYGDGAVVIELSTIFATKHVAMFPSHTSLPCEIQKIEHIKTLMTLHNNTASINRQKLAQAIRNPLSN